jgi:hypothetical protein
MDVWRSAASRGWELTREAAANPVDEWDFVENMTGLSVTVQSFPVDHDRVLAREGAESLWRRLGLKKWHIGRAAL